MAELCRQGDTVQRWRMFDFIAEVWRDSEHLRAAVVLASSLVAAWLLRSLLARTVGALVRSTKTDLDDELVDILRAPIFRTVILLGIWFASLELGLPGQLRSLYFRFILVAALQTFAIYIWSVAGLRIAIAVLQALSRRSNKRSLVQPRTRPIFEMLSKILVFSIAIYFIFLTWDIDVTAWLASAGIVGIAVGFAAKDTLANLFSGIFIVADAPYKLNDWIVLDDNLRGRVTHIGIRSTRVLTKDDIEITVPNAMIANSKIVNEAGGPYVKQRIRVQVQAAYGSDIDEVRRVLLAQTEGMNSICSSPKPYVRFHSFGDSGLNFELYVWIDEPPMKEFVLDDLNSKVYKAFGEANISIPFPQQDVHIKQIPAAVDPP